MVARTYCIFRSNHNDHYLCIGGDRQGKRQEMKELKLISGAVLATILIVGVAVALPPQARTQPASAAFDHTNCQYPDRWSNPADGCDNSDPAVPECIKSFSTKAGEDACIATFVEANSVNDTNNATQTPLNVPLTPAPMECGGK